MYDVPQLEKKWKKYKKKQRRKPVLIALISVLSVTAVSVLSILYLNNKETNSNKKIISNSSVSKNKHLNTTIKTIQKQPNVPEYAGNNVSDSKNNGIVIIKHPIKNNTKVSSSIASHAENAVKSNNDNTIDITKVQIVKPNVKDEDIQIIGFNNVKEKSEVESKYVQKKINPELEAIINVEERFKTTQDTQDSLYLAKYYYKKRQYSKAENWAINTNNIDGDIEDSWIIFAKSRAKQGKRVDAIKVLQTYYNETKSQKAKVLLKKLRLGNPFK